MSAGAAPSLRTISFGDLQTGVWGAAWGSVLAVGVVGDGETVLSPVTIEGGDENGDWRISSDDAELAVAPAGEAAIAGATSPGQPGFDQLCRVRGRFLLAGSERRVDCLGHRASRDQYELGRFESLRDVSAWFEPDEGVALTSMRPSRAAGHADDVVMAAVFEPGGATRVTDPRLSTTYTAAGIPARFSLELWLGHEDDEDDQEQQYPRRAAGEAVGAHADASGDTFELHAELLRCHTRGREGTGVYLLARPR